jgi:glycosyltransferase involved in cell wall biosynthesis
MEPELSVITAVYNGARFLPDAIDSVLAQTVSNFEFIIVDDGSTDETPDILERYRKQDSRIIILSQPNRGIPSSLNRAIAAARTDLLAHIDADDRALPFWLERQLQFLAQYPENSVVSSYAYLINSEGARIGKSQNVIDVEQGLREMNPQLFLDIVHSTVLMRKSKLLEVGGYREGQTYLEDRDLWGRLITAGQSIRCNPELLVDYRVHSGSVTVKKRSESQVMLGRSINLNVVRRLRGERELSPQEAAEWFASRPFFERLKENRRVISGRYFRTAARHYAEKRWLQCAWALGAATAIRPLYVLQRAARKAFG